METLHNSSTAYIQPVKQRSFKSPCEKMCGSKYHGPGAGAPGTLEKFFRMEQHENSPSLCFRACWIRF